MSLGPRDLYLPGSVDESALSTILRGPQHLVQRSGCRVARHRFDDLATRRLTVTGTFVWSLESTVLLPGIVELPQGVELLVSDSRKD